MFIQTVDTSNPETLKFILDEVTILESGSLEFKNKTQAKKGSKLATKLFEITNVKQVFFGTDFITITKNKSSNWDDLKTQIITAIMDFIMTGQDLINPNQPQEKPKKSKKNNPNQEIIDQINELIEEKVRPAVAMDGGDIVFEEYKDGIVYLRLKGSCSGCPSSSITLKNGIENMLQHYVPEIKEVRAVDFEEDY